MPAPTIDAGELDARISAWYRADPDAIAWPYDLYADLHAQPEGIVTWPSGPAVLLVRHADVKAVMAGGLPIANDGYRYGSLAEGLLARLPEEHREAFFRVFDFETLFLSRHNGVRHQRLRAVAARAFTARNVAALREQVQAHVDELLDELATATEPDVKAHLADKLPVRVIADLLGVPQSDRDLLWGFAEAIAAHFSLDEVSLRAADEALDAFKGYVGELIAGFRRSGQGPPLARVLIEGVDSGQLSEEELLAMELLILFGGSETTTNLLGNGFLALQRHREQWDLLVDDPTLVRGALDELMRYDSPHHLLPRVAEQDLELRGVRIAAGTTIVLVIGAANRDPAVFPDPDRLWLARPNRGEQLSFAYGPHFCLGAALARLEGEVAFTSLVRRFPDIRLLDAPIGYRGSAMLRAIRSLPVELGSPTAS
jgi:cytochrome P450